MENILSKIFSGKRKRPGFHSFVGQPFPEEHIQGLRLEYISVKEDYEGLVAAKEAKQVEYYTCRDKSFFKSKCNYLGRERDDLAAERDLAAITLNKVEESLATALEENEKAYVVFEKEQAELAELQNDATLINAEAKSLTSETDKNRDIVIGVSLVLVLGIGATVYIMTNN